MIGATVKHLAKGAFYGFALFTGPIALRNAWYRLRGRTRCTVIVYHRVNDHSRDNLTTSTQRFTEHLATLKRHYPVVSLSKALAMMGTGPYLGPNVVVITFDDGYADNHDAAAPILERFGLPASFFVTVGHVDTTRPFEHDGRSPHRFANLTWDQIRSLDARGFEIGSHGWSHKNLARCSPEDAHQEIHWSRDRLTQELSHPIRAFAYPFGATADITPEVGRAILEAGFQVILSAYGGSNVDTIDPKDVRRVSVSQAFNALAVRAQVEGITLYQLRRRFLGPVLRWARQRHADDLGRPVDATSGSRSSR